MSFDCCARLSVVRSSSKPLLTAARHLGALVAGLALALLSGPASAAIAFVQAIDTVPQTPQTSVSVTLPSAQVAGNLNVVVIGWLDSTASVQSVTDTRGNTYTLAVGPTTLSGSARQAMYYSAGILAGSNTVTVTFSPAASLPDLRVLEYSGIATSSVVDGTTSNSSTSYWQTESGSLTTTNADDLLVAASTVETWNTGPGTNFTQRLLPTPNMDITEDRFVSSAGTYSATSPLGQVGFFIMQMVAFKAAATGGDTQAPTAPTGLTATPVSSTQVDLSWTASTDNVAVTGYSVERCQGAGCTTFAAIGTPTGTTFSDTGRTASTTYRYQVRARDAVPNWSGYSSIATATTPAGGDTQAPTVPSGVTLSAGANQITVSWTASTDNVAVTGYEIQRCAATCTVFTPAGTATSYIDSTAAAGTAYGYQVRAKDAVPNYSAYSGTVSATPADCD